MTEDHWKRNLILALLPFFYLSGTLLQECNGQTQGSNFFYYYSPTQKTMINHGLTGGPGQIFSSPFFTQHHPQQQNLQQQPLEQPTARQVPQQQQAQPFPTVPPSFQQSTLLGFNHPHFQTQNQQQSQFGNVFPSAPPPQLQFPLVHPTPAQQQQEQLLGQQSSPAFSAFTRFGNNANLLGQFPQPSQPSFYSTQSPLGTVAPGAYNFFQSPFQFLQQRFLQENAQPTSVPTLPTPTTTIAPSPPPQPTPSPTPTSSEMMEVSPEIEHIVERRPKFSSRFRYVQQAPQPQIRQYNPYSRIGSPYTSDLPFQEQRFYSSPTTPTGYAFSLGGENGNGATSTVHFSMGPLNNIQQHLTEITATRRMLQRQRTEQSTPSVPEITTAPVPSAEMMMSHDAPSPAEPMMRTTMASPTTPAPTPQTPEPMQTVEQAPAAAAESMNSTLEPLLNEPSFQTETIAAPAPPPVAPEVIRKISETNIPKRLVIRKKVARKRLRLDGSGEAADNGTPPAMPVGVMLRRRIASPNRLPVEEPKQIEEEASKGQVEDSAQDAAAAPMTPSTTTTTTTAAPISEQMVDEPELEHDSDEQPAQEFHMESHPQQVSSTTTEAPQSMDVPMMPVEDEAHVSMGEMPDSHANENDDHSSDNLMQDQPSQAPMSSTTTAPEEAPAAMNNSSDNEEKQPSMEPLSTTPTPIQSPPVEAMMPGNEVPSPRTASIRNQAAEQQPSKHEEIEEYYEEYEDDAPIQRHSLVMPDGKIMTAVMVPESEDELPVLDGVQKEDFPGVFHIDSPASDNSVETDQGQVITRITSSHSSSAEHEEREEMMEAPPAPDMPSPPSIAPTRTTTTTEAAPPSMFERDDPTEEQPPADSAEPAAPIFQPTTTTSTTTTEAQAPMMTTTASGIMSSTASPMDPAEHFSDSMESGEEMDEEVHPGIMSSQEEHDDTSSAEASPPSSTEANMPQMGDILASSTTETGPHDQDQHAMVHEDAEAPEMINKPSVSSSTTEAIMSMNTTPEESAVIPEVEISSPSSTESTQQIDEEINSNSSTTVIPLSATTEAKSQEAPASVENQSQSQEVPSDSEEIGKAQRLALEETLRRLRERQQTSSTSEPQDQEDDSPENELQSGRRSFMRRPIQVANLPLQTSRPLQNVNAVLAEEEGVDRSQVIEKIQRFRARTTTTKRPRRVTRPSPSTERRLLAVVEPVEDFLSEDQEQVDSFSDSSSTPGTTIEPATIAPPTPTPTTKQYRSRTRTTPATSTRTIIPEESSTTPSTLDMEMEPEVNNPFDATATSTETYSTTTTPLPPMLTRLTDETSSTTESMMVFDSEASSSTTETDYEHEQVTTRMDQYMTGTTTSTTTTEATMLTTTTHSPMLTTTTHSPMMTSTTMPSTTTYSPVMTDDDISSDEKYDLLKPDDDVFYEENPANIPDFPVSSSTETSTEADNDATPSSTTTTTTPPSSTDAVYAYVTTAEPISSDISSTTISPDLSSSTMTTPAGQLIIHEILPTMPPLKEVSFVIGESVEDDQSSAGGETNSNSANESDELLAADKAVVRVEAKVHVSTNATDIGDAISGELSSQSQESQELTQPLINISSSVESAEGGQSGQRRVRVVVKKQRRLRRPGGGQSRTGADEARRRRRKVFYRRPQ